LGRFSIARGWFAGHSHVNHTRLLQQLQVIDPLGRVERLT
jgi:hypothetical protein